MPNSKRPPHVTMSTEDFDRILAEITADEDLLTVPGVYEIVAEHYNNDVLAAYDAEQADDQGEPEITEEEAVADDGDGQEGAR